MRFIKLALISVVVLFALATAITSLLPSTSIVSRAIDIVALPDSAYQYLVDPSNWQDWLHNEDNVEFNIDQQNKTIYFQNTTITFISSTPQQIATEWRVGQGTSMKGDFNIITSPNASVFTLQWAFTQKVKWYPWEKLASILSDKAVGPYMQKSLDNLKIQLENRASTNKN